MYLWNETSLKKLYDSSVKAFPQTTRRQHSTDTVRVESLRWVPFQGLGTLFLKGLAVNEGRKNEPIILFRQVQYKKEEGRGTVSIEASNGQRVHLESLSLSNNDVLVRCTCQDFRWRFCHWNKDDKSLYGRDRSRYEASLNPGSSNPEKSPGICKHLMKMAKILGESGVLGASWKLK
jgi:hypothetical protein